MYIPAKVPQSNDWVFLDDSAHVDDRQDRAR